MYCHSVLLKSALLLFKNALGFSSCPPAVFNSCLNATSPTHCLEKGVRFGKKKKKNVKTRVSMVSNERIRLRKGHVQKQWSTPGRKSLLGNTEVSWCCICTGSNPKMSCIVQFDTEPFSLMGDS